MKVKNEGKQPISRYDMELLRLFEQHRAAVIGSLMFALSDILTISLLIEILSYISDEEKKRAVRIIQDTIQEKRRTCLAVVK